MHPGGIIAGRKAGGHVGIKSCDWHFPSLFDITIPLQPRQEEPKSRVRPFPSFTLLKRLALLPVKASSNEIKVTQTRSTF